MFILIHALFNCINQKISVFPFFKPFSSYIQTYPSLYFRAYGSYSSLHKIAFFINMLIIFFNNRNYVWHYSYLLFSVHDARNIDYLFDFLRDFIQFFNRNLFCFMKSVSRTIMEYLLRAYTQNTKKNLMKVRARKKKK